MNDAQKFAYRVQGALAFFTVVSVVALAFVILLVKIQITQTLEALLNTAVGALIAWGGTSVAFWLARHRGQQSNGADDTEDSNPTMPEKPAGVSQ